MDLNVAITGSRELDIRGTGTGEVALTISNQSGGALKVKADAVAIDPSLRGCLEVVKGERFWEFANKGTHNITVRVKTPENAVDGKGKFRLVLADQATPDEVGAEGPEILVLWSGGGPKFKWWKLLVAAGVLLVVGGGLWLLWPKSVHVPDVVGKPMEEAQKMLEAVGLKGMPGDPVRGPADRKMEVGHVAVQDPEADVEVDKGSEVKLHPKVNTPKMPKFIGLHLWEVLAQVKEYRTGKFQHITTRKNPEGTVIDQNPKPGEGVTPETEVTLLIEGTPGEHSISEYLDSREYKNYLEQTSGKRKFEERQPDSDGLKNPKKEQIAFDVILKAAGGNKIQVIRVVRAATGCGLKEAKDLVDKSGSAIKIGVPKHEAESLAKELKDAGADVEIR